MGCLISYICRVFSPTPTNDKIYKELQDLKKLVHDEFTDVKRILGKFPSQHPNEDSERFKEANKVRHGGSSQDIELAPLLQAADVNEGKKTLVSIQEVIQY